MTATAVGREEEVARRMLALGGKRVDFTVPCAWCSKPASATRWHLPGEGTPTIYCSHPCYADMTRQRRNARKGLRTGLKKAVLKRDGGRCVACGTREQLTVDHWKPLRLGVNPHDIDNLVTMCAADNHAKDDWNPDDLRRPGPYAGKTYRPWTRNQL